MPTGYVLIFYWTIVALGGALFLGTGAALLQYRRTGTLPGEGGAQARPDDAQAASDGSQATSGRGPVGTAPSKRETSRVVLRCALGLVLVVAGAFGLVSTY
jgi:hypothetical protein